MNLSLSLLPQLVLSPDGFYPQITFVVQAFFRTAYGFLLFGHLVLLLPHAKRFFMSERWKGYAQSSWDVDVIQNPVAHPVVMLVWFGCAIALVFGRATVAVALINLLFCRYFFEVGS